MPTPGPSGTLSAIESYMVQAGYTSAQIQSFVTWYDAAVAQDPSLTPTDGYSAWALATSLGTSINTTAGVLGEVPGAIATGAENAPPVEIATTVEGSLANLTTGFEQFLKPFTTLFHDITSASFWERAVLVLLGAGLVIVGVSKIASHTQVGQAAAKVAKAAALT